MKQQNTKQRLLCYTFMIPENAPNRYTWALFGASSFSVEAVVAVATDVCVYDAFSCAGVKLTPLSMISDRSTDMCVQGWYLHCPAHCCQANRRRLCVATDLLCLEASSSATPNEHSREMAYISYRSLFHAPWPARLGSAFLHEFCNERGSSKLSSCGYTEARHNYMVQAFQTYGGGRQ